MSIIYSISIIVYIVYGFDFSEKIKKHQPTKSKTSQTTISKFIKKPSSS